MDKTTLGNAALLGLQTDLHLTAGEYNWLGTIFYVSYLLFEYPQNLALQRYPVGKWLAFNGIVWAVLVACQAACKNFWQIFWCRFLLGACEGSATAAFMISTSMFYTHREQSSRTGYWFLMNGISVATSSFLSYGVLHIHTDKLHPWQWFFIITAIVTLTVSLCLLLFFPDSPATAWFLTPEERVKAILRIKVNQTGVENKHFKPHQTVEALQDPKTWAWFFYSIFVTIPNITNQQSLIIKSLGYSTLKTTLLSSVIGFVQAISILVGVLLVRAIKNSRAIVAVVMSIPNITAAIMSVILPWSAKIALLIAIYLSWFASTVSYCIGNIIAPQLWQAQYKPRNILPWSLILSCYLTCSVMILGMRFYLVRQNKKRYQENHDNNEVDEKDNLENKKNIHKVDKAFMDLTDLENKGNTLDMNIKKFDFDDPKKKKVNLN
ncbi:hypothetical protein CROQUDRAFT_700947 [Cronartium quercuum f. sp. fusiforme G11]|uniref:Major facilitator superfamily (MFS) profile domain-containing protein n=1 Tax=Cronartium quercuum f. sp. fusiforme G11 TaxID=708437 RepID=A0A9P6TC13_9BASI|nr:hypothetical protein CROQUDRAFT_700947 [Cronartium quercuum f. sp. fusiforme G11]